MQSIQITAPNPFNHHC